MKKDTLHKTVIVFCVFALLGLGSYLYQRSQNNAPVPAPLPQKRENVVRKIKLEDLAPPPRRLTTDQAAIRGLQNCERQRLTITDCVDAMRRSVDVQAAMPSQATESGFQGFIMFPLNNGNNVIMDYNTQDLTQQSIFYGDFSSLQDLIEQGGMGSGILSRINSIEKRYPE